MQAFRFIKERRKSLERIDFVNKVRLAMRGSDRDVKKSMERWARDADVPLTFEE